MFDTLIVGGTVIDGSGRPGSRADVGIQAGRIAALGDLSRETADKTIDADGRAVAPGFIDSHCHSDLALIAEPAADCKAQQGVTTEVIGNCGWSSFPMAPATRDTIEGHARPIFGHKEVDWHWSDLAGYWQALGKQGVGVNVASLVGHGFVRNAVMGYEDRPPTDRELSDMQLLVQDAMDQGALGLSTGLCYAPGVYADTDELVALSQTVAANRGLYVTHLRDQGDLLVESVEEALTIGRKAQVPVVVSHHKTVGVRNRGKVKETLRLLREARMAGIETFSDVYPYIEGCSTMLSMLPPWFLSGSLDDVMDRLANKSARDQVAKDIETGLPGWENRIEIVGWPGIIIGYVASETNQDLEGLNLEEAAAKRNKPPLEFLFDLLLQERCDVGRLTINTCEEDVETVMTAPHTMIGSDGIDAGAKPHPRLYGCFPKVLGTYVRERNVFSLEEGIHRMTGLTATTLGFNDIGFVREGYVADLVVFDPETIGDTATFKEPRQYPKGIGWVMVGGVVSVAEGRITGDLNGRVLRRHA